MFWRKLVGDWFSRWKGYSTRKTVNAIEETNGETAIMTDKHDKKVE